jgi:M6 family metalloprotease-like protein
MRVALLLATALASISLAEDAPDFAGTIATKKLAHADGKRKVLAILWDPKRAGEPAPPAAAIDALLFGERSSVAGWFRENSGGKLTIERAGVLGWYPAKKPADHYWNTTEERDPRDSDGDGWLNGHVEKWAEAIQRAAQDVKLSSFDTNKDGVLTPDELAILVVIPQSKPFGTNRSPAGREAPHWEPLVVDGVKIPVIAEWYTGDPPNLGAPAHELCHLLLGAPDMYMTGPWPFAAGIYSLMDLSYSTTHLDPFEKLKLGWLEPDVVSTACERDLADVETRRKALVLWDPRHGPSEYFLVENRWRAGSYDAGIVRVGVGLPQDGLAVWHVIEDPKAFDTALQLPPTGGEGDWGRRGIRLIRRNGGMLYDDGRALLDHPGDSIDDRKGSARLVWLDGTPSGFSVTLLGPPGPTVRVKIGKNRKYL